MIPGELVRNVAVNITHHRADDPSDGVTTAHPIGTKGVTTDDAPVDLAEQVAAVVDARLAERLATSSRIREATRTARARRAAARSAGVDARNARKIARLQNGENPVTGEQHIPLRDPETGALNFKVSIDVHLAGRALPLVIDCRDWTAALAWLRSAEFKRMRDGVDFVTITNREGP